MDSAVLAPPVNDFASRDPAALAIPTRPWLKLIGPVLSLAVVAVVLHEFRLSGFIEQVRRLPLTPSFWTLFLLFYCVTPIAEWAIFRRIWSIPSSGFGALLRKQISNELLFDYLGEVHFYAWARQRLHMTTAPFGAIKDVAIVSAICGSAFTLAMLPLFGGLLQALSPDINHGMLIGSALIVLASLFAPLLLRPRLFSLPSPQLWFIARVQMLRIVAIFLLSALLWHMVLPQIALGWWFLLAALRQLVSRLPLLPNKDVLFVGAAVFFLGHQSQITQLMVAFVGVTLALHLLVAAVIGFSDFVGWRR